MPFHRSPRKIVVIKLRALGDTVLMTAGLRELRHAFPEAEIHAVVTAAWSPLFKSDPTVNKVWEYERHRDPASRAKALAGLALRLRREKFDWAICLHASPSSSTLAFATGAKIRSIHFHGHHDKNKHSTVEIPGKGMVKPNIERDMDALRALGIHVPAGRMPHILLQPSEKTAAEGRIAQLHLGKPLLGIALGSSRPTKCWPVDRYAGLAVAWCRQTQGSVLAFVGPGETSLEHEFLKQLDEMLTHEVADDHERPGIRARIACQAGLPLRTLAGAISQCTVLVGNDSGPRHIAVAVGTPTVTLFGPEDPYEWHPYPLDLHPYHFVEGLGCRRDAAPGMPAWCGLHVCKVEQHRCMTHIGVNAVLESCLKQLH